MPVPNELRELVNNLAKSIDYEWKNLVGKVEDGFTSDGFATHKYHTTKESLENEHMEVFDFDLFKCKVKNADEMTQETLYGMFFRALKDWIDHADFVFVRRHPQFTAYEKDGDLYIEMSMRLVVLDKNSEGIVTQRHPGHALFTRK